MTRRICLLAGYHPNNQVSDYVVYYVRALAQVADVYYWADGSLPAAQLDKLTPYTKGAWAQRHAKHDFGSWQAIIRQIGWDQVRSYDECILANDSVFAPLFPIRPFFDKGTASHVDAWALNAYEHTYLESYFVVLKKPVLMSTVFHDFIENITQQPTVNDIIVKYEHGLTQLLHENGFSYGVFANFYHSAADEWCRLIRMEIPVFKIKVLTKYRVYVAYEWLPGWKQFLQKHTTYPVALIEQHLQSVGMESKSFDSWGFYLKSVWWTLQRLRRNCFRIHFHQQTKIIVLFGITLLNTDRTVPLGKITQL